MNINWKVRVKNPVFWANVSASILIPLIAGVGFEWSQMTTWATLGEVLLSAIQNPVVVAAMLVSLWNALNDPTTAGLSDSSYALSKDEPTKTGKHAR